MNLVVDASVIVKWALPDSEAEADKEEALRVLAAIESGEASPGPPVTSFDHAGMGTASSYNSPASTSSNHTPPQPVT
jgi:hypothetical protein